MRIEAIMSDNPCEQPPVYKLYLHTFLGFGSTLRGRAARLEHYTSATSCSIRPWDSSVGTSTLGRPASYTPWLCGRLLLAGTGRGLNLGQPPGRATLQPTMENNYGDGTKHHQARRRLRPNANHILLNRGPPSIQGASASRTGSGVATFRDACSQLLVCKQAPQNCGAEDA
jgi:hypothetical protein